MPSANGELTMPGRVDRVTKPAISAPSSPVRAASTQALGLPTWLKTPAARRFAPGPVRRPGPGQIPPRAAPSVGSSTGREHLHQPGDDRVPQRVQLVIAGRPGLDEGRHTIGAAAVHAVQHRAVQVDVQVGGGSEALDQRDGAAVAFVASEPNAIAGSIALGLSLCGMRQFNRQSGFAARCDPGG